MTGGTMSGSNVESQTKAAMQAALEHLRQELKSLRTGRASSSMLDKVSVEVYGTQMRIRDVANVTVPEPRQILVSPFDASNVNAIKKGIEIANIGLTPMVDGKVIRINVPAMDETTRKQIAGQCKKFGEQSKIAIREIRRKNNDLARKMKSDGEIPEDMLKKLEKGIQDLTDKFCKEVDEVVSQKEKEILTI